MEVRLLCTRLYDGQSDWPWSSSNPLEAARATLQLVPSQTAFSSVLPAQGRPPLSGACRTRRTRCLTPVPHLTLHSPHSSQWSAITQSTAVQPDAGWARSKNSLAANSNRRWHFSDYYDAWLALEILTATLHLRRRRDSTVVDDIRRQLSRVVKFCSQTHLNSTNKLSWDVSASKAWIGHDRHGMLVVSFKL